MMLSMLIVSASLAVGQTAGPTQDAAAALVEEMPKAPGEGEEPAAAKALEAEMDAKRAPAAAKTKRETKDWADEERWGRYRDDQQAVPAHGGAPGATSKVNLEWPGLLRRRSPGGAFVLGGLVGFGSGFYYAGEARRGLFFSAIDGALILGFVGTTVALNKLVIDHDFETGKSLASGDREIGKMEGQLYVASVLFALAEVGSRVFQGIGSMQAARRTNTILEGVSYVPMQGGGGASLTLGY